MEQSGYIQTLQFLNKTNTPVSPHEIALSLGKSRVTIQAALKRLLFSGWVEKEGSSPHVLYRAVDPFAKQKPGLDARLMKLDPHSVEAFITWCKAHNYHVPEIAGEYLKFLKVTQK